MSYVPKAMNYKHHITFKGLQETVHKLNNKLEKHPISGLFKVICFLFWVLKIIHESVVRWGENGRSPRKTT